MVVQQAATLPVTTNQIVQEQKVATLPVETNQSVQERKVATTRESHLSGWFGFVLLQNFGPVWGPINDICCSVNVDGVLVLLGGGGDTSTLHGVIELFFEIFDSVVVPFASFAPFIPFTPF